MLLSLNLLQYQTRLKIRDSVERRKIWDPVRRLWISLSPEEMVRQLILCHLLEVGFSSRLIQVEKTIIYNQMPRRFDIVAYHKDLVPFVLVECKAPNIKIDQKVFDQIAQYNMSLTVPFLWVSNGRENYCCRMNYQDRSYTFIDHIPTPL